MDHEIINKIYIMMRDRYAAQQGVTGVDIGYKYKDGKRTQVKAVRIHVKEKIPKNALESLDVFPTEIDGVPVDVIQGDYHANIPRSV